MALRRFLHLAARAARALADLHARGAVHGALTPAAIQLDPAGEISVAPPGEPGAAPGEPGAIAAEQLPYAAPEQTGRTHRPVDARSDLYALGACFHEWLTGLPPFASADPLELVHAHLARAPPSPRERRPDLPEVVCAIVLTLLAKLPEDRYQSAAGLAHDLEECARRLDGTGAVAAFPLARRDQPGAPRPPRRLYGRGAELARLLDALGRVARDGGAELALIAGPAGVGKTALVAELRPAAARAGGALVAGKFDQFQKDAPYTALTQILDALVQRALSGADAEVEAARERVAAAIGPGAAALLDLCPRLGALLGPAPRAPEAPPEEAQRRLWQAARRLICAFAAPGRPLVIFVDDLQWADPASLGVLGSLVGDPDAGHLLLVGACRDAGLDPAHPLLRMVDAIERGGAPVLRLEIAPLPAEGVEALIADALGAERSAVRPLARLLHELTGGNPFFLQQLLEVLHREGLVAYAPDAGAWRWDAARIRARATTDSVADLMAARLRLLPERTQRALAAAAACADADALAAVEDLGPAGLDAALAPAALEGLVRREGGRVLFAHDRIQQAAHALLDEAARPALHARIARRLLAATPPEQIPERVFDIVDQLHRARLDDPAERRRAAALDLLAARRARASGAHAAAARYFAAGLDLLGEGGWDDAPALARDLELGAAEGDYLGGRLDEAESRAEAILRRARAPLEASAARCVAVRVHITRGAFDRALEVGLAGLAALGVELRRDPPEDALRSAIDALRAEIEARGEARVLDLPELRDEAVRAALELAEAMMPAALFLDERLAALLHVRAVELYLAHGHADLSAHTYASFGLILVSARHLRYREAERFIELGSALADRRGLAAGRAKILLLRSIVLRWVRHARESERYAAEAFRAAVEQGDQVFACYACNHLITSMLARGAPLDEVLRETEARLRFVRRAGDENVADILLSQQRFARALRGETRSLGSFAGPDFDEAAFEARLPASQMKLMVAWYHVLRLEARYLDGDVDGCLESVARAEEVLWSTERDTQLADFHFFAALARLRAHERAQAGEAGAPAELPAAIREHARLLDLWAEICPDNFAGRAALCAAEIARVLGQRAEADRRFEGAVAAFRRSGVLQGEALAQELLSAHLRAAGLGAAADACLREARRLWLAWGAAGKARQIERRAPHLAEPAALARAAVGVEQLDARSLIKASQAISEEIVPDRLGEKLARILLESAGAQRGLLLGPGPDGLAVLARAAADTAAAARGDAAPRALVSYARRTRERVVVADAALEHPFAADPYFAEHPARSVACLPLARRGHLVALLYLEHALVAGLFSPDRLAALELLGAQAATSLENAALYGDLERRIALRTRELEEAHQQLLDMAEAQRRAHQASLAAQAEVLLALSTPLLPIHDDVVVMPLVGALDARRVQRVREVLIQGVADMGVAVAILDLTGVPALDEELARGILAAAQAVRLLGAESVLTGLRGDVARTLAQLGVDLGGISVHRHLRAGVAHAMRARRGAAR